MKKRAVLFLWLFFFIVSCATVPVTGRRQLALIPTSQINALSFSSYNDFLSKNKVIEGTSEAQLVKSVGKKIQQAVEQYFA